MKFALLVTLYLVPCSVFGDEYRSLMDPIKSEEQVNMTRSSMDAVQQNQLKPEVVPTESSARPVRRAKAKKVAENSNAQTERILPNEYFKRNTSFVPGDKAVYVSVKKGTLPGILRGVKFEAVINEAITVSQTVTNPVSAIIVSGPYSGSSVIGDARLDKELHRVLIDFSSITLKDQKQTFMFKGSALGEKGIGLYGDYHTQSGLFMIGEFASAAAAAWSDAQIDRSPTLSGGYIAAPTMSNAAMSGLTSTLTKSADKFAQGAAGTSDYTNTEVFQKFVVIVTEEPTLKD